MIFPPLVNLSARACSLEYTQSRMDQITIYIPVNTNMRDKKKNCGIFTFSRAIEILLAFFLSRAQRVTKRKPKESRSLEKNVKITNFFLFIPKFGIYRYIGSFVSQISTFITVDYLSVQILFTIRLYKILVMFYMKPFKP